MLLVGNYRANVEDSVRVCSHACLQPRINLGLGKKQKIYNGLHLVGPCKKTLTEPLLYLDLSIS